MPTNDVSSPDRDDAPADRLIRGLEQRYRTVLVSVALMLVLDQVVLQPLLVQFNGLAPAINLAGRQRMLSQRITKAALAMQREGSAAGLDSYRAELNLALDDWRRVHVGLQTGDDALQLEPAPIPQIRRALLELDETFLPLATAASRIVAGASPQPGDVDTILAMERSYLSQMDEIVALYESEAQRQVSQLRFMSVGGLGLVLLLLLGLGRLVIRPAVQLIRRQMEELVRQGEDLRLSRDRLEERVQERTKELTVVNAALEREIEDRLLAEESTLVLRQQLAHAGRVTSLGQLATGLAHEINQPLAAITNYAESADLELTRRGDAAAAKTCVERIREAALRAGQIVRRMRNFLRPADVTFAVVSLRELVEDILQLCSFELKQAHVQVSLELDREIDDAVSADAIQIQQVLVNLVQNSLQAMTDVSQPRLKVRLNRDQQELHVDVEDNGFGFDAVALAAFDSSFITTKSDGLGLGLAISKSIVAAHGGRLWAANRDSGGAIVSFALPAACSHVDDVESAADCLCRG